ncbi:phage protein GemA/Gp16 family protein [Maridesulfovibrio bastinii]|uniref:phage protein GemA/Gp16 family protein n=1 Tax=Maridesulfovibrio bastinii TaxID=47157 RepID=UPI00040DD426|nr:phage protein GemA/Gp16 family protein [Maridesulfovibrio bastinii]
MNYGKKQLIQKAAIARKQIGIDDEAYMILLKRRYQVDSSTKLNIKQLHDLIHNVYICEMGWKPQPAKIKNPTPTQKKGKGYQGEFVEISDKDPLAKQKRYALILAKKLGWNLYGLDSRCKKQFGVERFVWIREQAHMQTLLKDMQQRCNKRGIDYSTN